MLFAPKAGSRAAQPARRAGRQSGEHRVGRLSPRAAESRRRTGPRRAARCRTTRRATPSASGADEAQRYVREATGERANAERRRPAGAPAPAAELDRRAHRRSARRRRPDARRQPAAGGRGGADRRDRAAGATDRDAILVSAGVAAAYVVITHAAAPAAGVASRADVARWRASRRTWSTKRAGPGLESGSAA